MAADLRQKAAYYLSLTVSGDQASIRAADESLKQLTDSTAAFSLTLLSILSASSHDPSQVKHAAAIFFKNLLKKLWPTDVRIYFY